MEIRKAKKADIDSIEKIYERIHDGEEKTAPPQDFGRQKVENNEKSKSFY